MTTKAPSSVSSAPPGSREAIAYGSVKNIPTVEPHDQDRLGYAVWRWLTLRNDSLEAAVRAAGIRLLISEQEAVARIREHLSQQGITLE